MKPQLYVGKEEPTPERMQPVKNSTNCLGAKPEGGLWTSTYDPEYGSDWIRWCLAEDFHVPRGGWHSWLLTPRTKPNLPRVSVVTIKSAMDLACLLQQFGRNPFPDIDSAKYGIPQALMPDYEKLAAWAFDAVHLTEEGQWKTRHSMPHNLYGWDCESTVWLNWAFEKVEYLGVCTWQPNGQREIASLLAEVD